MMIASMVKYARSIGERSCGYWWPLLLVIAAMNASNALANQDIPFKELGGDQCFMFPQFYEHEDTTQGLVITNDADYQKLFDQKNMRQSCAGGDLSKLIPQVDFSKETVLGLWSSGSCAAARVFKKRVAKDDIQKTILYSVEVTHRIMACSGPGPESLNLIAIPAVPPGYKVIFENIPE